MLTLNRCLFAGSLLILMSGEVRSIGGEDPTSPSVPPSSVSQSSSTTITVEACTVRFVNKPTYSTARPGIIAELPFEEGDHVNPGDLVVGLRDEVARVNLKLRAAQAEMESKIKVAEKDRDAAKIAYESAVQTNRIAANSYPQSEVARLKLIFEARVLQVTQAEDELRLNQIAKEQAQAELDGYQVYAKFGGLVTKVHKHVGEAVNLGDEIVTIYDTSRVRVEGRLPYAQVRRLQVGDQVRIQLDFNTRNTSSRFRFRGQADHETTTSGLLASDDEPTRQSLPEEQEVFVGRIGFIGVNTESEAAIRNDIRVWAEVVNRDNILLEGLPAKMTVQVQPRSSTP